MAEMARARSPSETVDMMRPFFAELGITRIARQSGLDRVGLPCFASIRPASLSLAVNQGKGLNDDEARAAAVMEAVEFAMAERPRLAAITATARSLAAAGRALYLVQDLLPLGRPLDPDKTISWVEGRAMSDQAPVWVPRAAVTLDAQASDLPGICHTTNGLASGNTRAEALLHGLCELVERDATTLWYLSGAAVRAASRVDPAAFDSPALKQLVARIAANGLAVRIFEQTCDTGIPVFMAAIAMFGGAGLHFQICSGYAAGLDPAQAALRALCEACQSRVTTIASARDDIAAALFIQPLDEADFDLFQSHLPARPPNGAPARFQSHAEAVDHIVQHLVSIGIGQPIAVDLGGTDMPCSVVRVLCPDLEAMGANTNWRPGRRAAENLF